MPLMRTMDHLLCQYAFDIGGILFKTDIDKVDRHLHLAREDIHRSRALRDQLHLCVRELPFRLVLAIDGRIPAENDDRLIEVCRLHFA